MQFNECNYCTNNYILLLVSWTFVLNVYALMTIYYVFYVYTSQLLNVLKIIYCCDILYLFVLTNINVTFKIKT